jgi:hypothetical protein
MLGEPDLASVGKTGVTADVGGRKELLDLVAHLALPVWGEQG